MYLKKKRKKENTIGIQHNIIKVEPEKAGIRIYMQSCFSLAELDWISVQSWGALGHNPVGLWCHHTHWYHPLP